MRVLLADDRTQRRCGLPAPDLVCSFHFANSRLAYYRIRRNSHRLECCSEVNRWRVSGSSSASPPQTSQRRWPLPWHCPQIPTTTPAKQLPPEPLQTGHVMVLWPWHLGHRVLVGIARPPSSNNTKE